MGEENVNVTALASGFVTDDGVDVGIVHGRNNSNHDDRTDPRHNSHLSYEEEIVEYDDDVVVEDDDDDDVVEEVVEDDDDDDMLEEEEEVVDESEGGMYEEEIFDDDVVEEEEVVVDDEHDTAAITTSTTSEQQQQQQLLLPTSSGPTNDETDEIIVEDFSHSHNDDGVLISATGSMSHRSVSYHPDDHEISVHEECLPDVVEEEEDFITEAIGSQKVSVLQPVNEEDTPIESTEPEPAINTVETTENVLDDNTQRIDDDDSTSLVTNIVEETENLMKDETKTNLATTDNVIAPSSTAGQSQTTLEGLNDDDGNNTVFTEETMSTSANISSTQVPVETKKVTQEEEELVSSNIGTSIATSTTEPELKTSPQITIDAPSSIDEPKVHDPDGYAPLKASLVTEKAIPSSSSVHETSTSSDPPEMITPYIPPPPKPVLIDPPEEDELMKSPTRTQVYTNSFRPNDSLSSTHGDELMGRMSEKNRGSTVILNAVPVVATAETNELYETTNNEDERINDLNQSISEVESTGVTVQSVGPTSSYAQEKLPKHKSLQRPFDEQTERDDPTDEGLHRAEETAMLAAMQANKQKKPVAPALRTLSKEQTKGTTNPVDIVSKDGTTSRPYDELQEDLTEVSERSQLSQKQEQRPVVTVTPMMTGSSVMMSPSESQSYDDEESLHLKSIPVATPTVLVGATTAALVAAAMVSAPPSDPTSIENVTEPEVTNSVETEIPTVYSPPVAPAPIQTPTPAPTPTTVPVPVSNTIPQTSRTPSTSTSNIARLANNDVPVGSTKNDQSINNNRNKSINERKDTIEAPLLAPKVGRSDQINGETSTPFIGASDRELDDDRPVSRGFLSTPLAKGIGIFIFISAVIVAIVVPIMSRKKSTNRDFVIPTEPPSAIRPTTLITSAPGLSPERVWGESIPPLVGDSGSGLGSAVAVDGTLLAVGAALVGAGTVSSFRFEDSSNWNIVGTLSGPENGSQFGSSIDIDSTVMVVGCPLRTINGTRDSAGSVLVYQYLVANNSWKLLGSEVRGDEDIFAAGEEFGFSVGIATDVNGTYTLVAGAPRSNKGEILQRGRVYTYRSSGVDNTLSWMPMDANTSVLLGSSPYDRFGAALDISQDGSRIIVGAPGNGTGSNGYAKVFSWTGVQWTMVFEKEGSVGAEMGSSVAFLSPSGDQFAIGSPGVENATGMVSFFSTQSTSRKGIRRSLVEQVGNDVVGKGPGERLGDFNSLSAATLDGVPSLVASSASGIVDTLHYDTGSASWKSTFVTLKTGDGKTVVGLSSEESGILAIGKPNDDSMALFSNSLSVTNSPTSGAVSPTIPAVPSGIPAQTPSTAVQPMVPPSMASPALVPVAAPVPVQLNTTTVPVPVQLNTTTVPVPVLANVTSAPVPVPVQSVATTSPSPPLNSPTSSNVSWVETNHSFTPRETGWQYGTSVGISTAAVAIGAPMAIQNGAVLIHNFDPSSKNWVADASSQLFGESAGDSFGASLDFGGNVLIVGAPNAVAPGTPTPAGAGYCYIKSGQTWTLLGRKILSNAGVYAAGERFGASVAISSNEVVVIGASGSSLGGTSQAGCIYIYRYDSKSSQWILSQNVTGIAAQGGYGSSVDVSDDGSRIIAGGPLADGGYATIYEVNGTSWTSVFLEQGDEADDRLGSSVKFLSSDGSLAAIGSPQFGGTKGKVQVFQKQGASYAAMGDPIVGLDGEYLGSAGMVSGGTILTLGTAQGQVKSYKWDSSTGLWSAIGNVVETGYSALLQVASLSDASKFIVGSASDDIQVYQQQ